MKNDDLLDFVKSVFGGVLGLLIVALIIAAGWFIVFKLFLIKFQFFRELAGIPNTPVQNTTSARTPSKGRSSNNTNRTKKE
jgi:hypothetical protein